MDPKVKTYIDKQSEFKQTILINIRQLILDTIPNCKEEFAWGVPVYDGGKFYLGAMKQRVHLGFAITGLSPDEIKAFEGTGKTMRHLKIHSLAEYDPVKLKQLIKLVHSKTVPPPDYQSQNQ